MRRLKINSVEPKCFPPPLKILALASIMIFFTIALFPSMKIYNAAKTNVEPIVDGRLDDSVWDTVEWGDNFTQKMPYEGNKPSQKTCFKILYNNKNIFIGIRAFDSSPEKIVQQMTRRDNREGDWIEVVLDSYFDRRTAFAFAVTAAGVKNDAIISEDGNGFDESWDPIWYVKTTVDKKGWNAEMCIPLSQLRFDKNAEQTWGLHVVRFLHRTEELSEWKLVPRNASGWVSLFGYLKGLTDIKPKRQIELLPYSVGKYQFYHKETGNPFSVGHEGNITGGLDGKIGISNNLTLDFTINPDFGQVEADPSEVNLTAFETFFEEKRPFFVEGRNILDFSITTGGNQFAQDNLFYSRRIGRTPYHYPDLTDDEFIDIPQNTTIIAAFKLTGKTRNGLSLGILDSITAKETSIIDNFGLQRNETVEPFTNYFVLRLQKDYDKGNTIIGGMVTATNRDIDEEHLNYMHRSAYTGGLDFAHKWKNKEWSISLNTVFSNVKGDKEAILETQESSRRYFQRPDADHVTLDPDRTSLSGHGGTLTFGKIGGQPFRFTTFVTWRSPGLELNDVGYLRSADRIFQVFWAQYRITRPFSIFRNFFFNFNQWKGWDFSGENTMGGVNINLHASLKNYWGLSFGINRDFSSLSPSELRGGPSLKMPGQWNYWLEVRSDQRNKIRFSLGNSYNWGDLNSSNLLEFWGTFFFRPTNALSMSIQPSYSFYKQNLQYVDTVETYSENDNRYIFARINQKTLALTLRLNFSITPDLSIQFYGQPFLSSGKYYDFKHIINSRADNYHDRFHVYDQTEITYSSADEYFKIMEQGPEAALYEFEDPNFNSLQFQSNLVIRWEYVPGSTLYLVWSQGRVDTVNNGGDFSFSNGMRDLFKVPPHDVFLIKFTYRFKI